MHKYDGGIRLSASDSVNHLSCEHLTRLNTAAATGEMEAPSRHDPFLELLQQRGADHEEKYIQHLKDRGLEIVRIGGESVQDTTVKQTEAAMRGGADVIVQGALAHGRWCNWRCTLGLELLQWGTPYAAETDWRKYRLARRRM